ncbi:unnamed protein product [Euphydryas editha]|uniref:Uncharacterized protein n=1 Tax=Euphydryas editha TaxID=104508 RepID=A0AAU9UV10_EUPED|nr:unnamed protein product [Euphydryas editha]
MLYYRNPYEFQNEETVHIRDLTLDKTQLLTVGNIYYNCDKHLSLRDTIVLNPDLNTDIYFTNQDTTLVNDPSQKSLAFVQSLINYQDYCNNWNSDIRMQLVDNTKKRTILAMLTSNTRPLSVEDLTNKSLPTSLATVDWNEKFNILLAKQLSEDVLKILLANTYRLAIHGVRMAIFVSNEGVELNTSILEACIPNMYSYNLLNINKRHVILLVNKLDRATISSTDNKFHLSYKNFNFKLVTDVPTFAENTLTSGFDILEPVGIVGNSLSTADIILADPLQIIMYPGYPLEIVKEMGGTYAAFQLNN